MPLIKHTLSAQKPDKEPLPRKGLNPLNNLITIWELGTKDISTHCAYPRGATRQSTKSNSNLASHELADRVPIQDIPHKILRPHKQTTTRSKITPPHTIHPITELSDSTLLIVKNKKKSWESHLQWLCPNPSVRPEKSRNTIPHSLSNSSPKVVAIRTRHCPK